MEKQKDIIMDYKNKASLLDAQRSLFVTYAPLAKREDLYKLIIINGEIASIREKVSEAAQGLTRLHFWLMQLENIKNNQPLHSPEAHWLGSLVQLYDLSLGDLQNWIMARQKEYEPMPLSSLEDWYNYRQKTGGLLNRFWFQILGEKEKEAQNYAEAIGRLWAGVGHLRAISFHSYIRLNLLPKALLYKHGFLLPDGWRPSAKDDLSAVVENLAHILEQELKKLENEKIHKSLKLKLVYAKMILAHFKNQNYNPFAENWTNIPKKTYGHILIKSFFS